MFGLRFFFIVLTDSTCWGPIIVLKILAFMDVDLPGDTLAWLIVFVLPFNSAVNPLLYTFSTPKYRDQIYTTVSTKNFSKKHDSSSNQGCNENKTISKTV
jgi:relaxin family peptide receptor 2